MRKRIGKNLFWTIVNTGSERSFYFVITIYLARVLGVEAFGVFIFTQTVVRAFWMAVDLGVSRYGTREIAKSKKNAAKLTNSLFSMRMLQCLLVVVIFYSYAILWGFNIQNKAAMLFGGLFLITNAIHPGWILMGFEDFKSFALGTLGSALFLLVGVVLLVKGPNNLNLALLLWALSYLISSFGLIYVLWKNNIRILMSWEPAEWLRHFKESLHFAISSALAGVLSMLPIFIVAKYSDSVEIGIFSAAYVIATSANKLGSLIQSSYYPVLSERFHLNNAEFKALYYNFMLIIGAIGIAIAGSIALLSGSLLPLALGGGYEHSVDVLRVLMIFVAIKYINVGMNSAIMATGFHRYQSAAFVVPIVVLFVSYVLLDFVDMPAMRIAVSCVISEVVYLIVLTYVSGKTYLACST